MRNLKFDKEYSTQYWKEVKYLESNGIKYSFVKTLENGISVFKYTKTPQLFKLLELFYLENK